MRDEDIADLHAGQTALIVTLMQLLIEKKIIGASEALHSLNEAKASHLIAKGNPRTLAPILHAISVLRARE